MIFYVAIVAILSFIAACYFAAMFNLEKQLNNSLMECLKKSAKGDDVPDHSKTLGSKLFKFYVNEKEFEKFTGSSYFQSFTIWKTSDHITSKKIILGLIDEKV